MTQLSDITSIHWQPKLGADEVVTNYDDINQCIRTIIGTPKGALPLRPLFGCYLYNYLDRPIDRARPHIVREVVEAINDPIHGEPRVTVERVLVDAIGIGHAVLRVISRLADGVKLETRVTL
ncbi:GPW/gp25 family protein [Sapientia aquatica]|uniref:Baseplate protein n=1 Tax=Sapientia aquatica TaxID=1549640 RepID=A0A4R5W3R1_9BURK|nr:GPW/gp25 family protein [Sapientia aquatica]TDK65969.1 baseplate protein [Sapientia aquatica]